MDNTSMDNANMDNTALDKVPEYILDRVFDAPRELVWQAWTDPTLLAEWYGPGIQTTIHKFDLKPGGMWLNEMSWDGNSNYSKMVFQEVLEPEKLVWHHSSTDSAWNIINNPMMADWPRILLTTVTFEEEAGKTKVRLSQIPLNATEAELTCFAKMMAGMDNGWGKGYAIIDQILEDLE